MARLRVITPHRSACGTFYRFLPATLLDRYYHYRVLTGLSHEAP